MDDRSGALSLGWRWIRRQLGSEPGVVASIATSVLITAFLLSAAPRLFEEVSGEHLFGTVSEALPAQRNIRVEREGRIGAGAADDPMSLVRQTGERFAETAMPPAVSSVVSEQYFLVDSPEFTVAPVPGVEPPHPFETFITFRQQEHIEGHATLVAGTMPSPQESITMLVGDHCPQEAFERERLTETLEASGPDRDIGCALEDVPHYQIAVSRETALELGYEIGEPMVLRPDTSDPILFGLSIQDLDYQLVASISGIVEFSDPDGEYWYGDPSLHRPTIRENADLRFIHATGLMGDDDYRALLGTTGDAGRLYTWRHFVDPALVEEADVDALISELIPFQRRHTGGVGLSPGSHVITQLSELLRTHIGQREETLALISIAAVGLLSAALAVIALLGVLMTARQRTAVILARNRGGSGGQLVLTRLYEALLLSVPAAVVGYAIATSLVPDTSGLVPYRTTVALAGGATVGLVSAGVPLFRRRLGSLQGRDAMRPRAPARRLVFDVFVFVVTLGSVVLLRRRGEANAQTTGEFDLLLALTPSLIAVTVGLIVIRLYPLAIRALSWLGAKTRGLVSFVGFRRVLRQNRLPVLVVLLCIAVATTASVMRSSIIDGQQLSAWQEVGADYTVEGYATGVALPSSIDFDALGPVDRIAYGKFFERSDVEFERDRAAGEVLAIDSQAYAAVTEGTLGDPRLPRFMFLEPGSDIGTEGNPIPAIVSRDWPSGMELTVGDVFTLDLGSLEPYVEVRELRDSYPDIDVDSRFVVLDMAAVEAFSEFPISRSVAYLKADAEAEASLRSQLADSATSAVLTSRYATLERIADDPFVRWASRSLQLVLIFGAVFAALVAIAGPAIATAMRRRDLAYLRTLGLDERQSIQMTIIEQVPPVLLGTVVGVSTGIVSTWLLRPVLTLEALTGNLVPTSLTLDWSALGPMVLALLGIQGLAVAIFVLVNRRTQLTAVLRVGDE